MVAWNLIFVFLLASGTLPGSAGDTLDAIRGRGELLTVLRQRDQLISALASGNSEIILNGQEPMSGNRPHIAMSRSNLVHAQQMVTRTNADWRLAPRDDGEAKYG